jgi:hypothetical protein
MHTCTHTHRQVNTIIATFDQHFEGSCIYEDAEDYKAFLLPRLKKLSAMTFGTDNPLPRVGTGDQIPASVHLYPLIVKETLQEHRAAALDAYCDARHNQGRNNKQATLMNWSHDEKLENSLQKIQWQVCVHKETHAFTTRSFPADTGQTRAFTHTHAIGGPAGQVA